MSININKGVKYYVINGHLTHDGLNIRSNGQREYFLNGVLHREDGPAVEHNGIRSWYLNGRLHRWDGPAIEIPRDDGTWKFVWYFEGTMINSSVNIKYGQRRFLKKRDEIIIKEVQNS